MAQVKIYAKRALKPRQRALSDAIHAAVIAALHYPLGKRFQRFFWMDDSDFIYPPNRSDSYVIIEISMFEGRSVEAKKHLEMTRASIANTMTNPMVDDPRILHVPYTDCIADPVATVGRYYAFCGRVLTSETEASMRDYLARNRGDRYGKFRYSTGLLIDIGENLEDLHAEFAPFRERFGVSIEKSD